jgi:toxin ParE1/3/4
VSPQRRKWDVRLSLADETDVDDIVFWTADRFGETQARAYEDILKKAVFSLREGPSRAGSRPRPDIGPRLYSLHIARISRRARHLIFFEVVSDNRIEVVRILHDGMDFQRHLPGHEAEET